MTHLVVVLDQPLTSCRSALPGGWPTPAEDGCRAAPRESLLAAPLGTRLLLAHDGARCLSVNDSLASHSRCKRCAERP